MRSMLKHMFNHGAERVYMIIPFPNSHMGYNDTRAWEFYEVILDTYRKMASEWTQIILLDFNHLVSRKTDLSSGVFIQKDGRKLPNYNLFSNSFTLTHNCVVTPSPFIIKRV